MCLILGQYAAEHSNFSPTERVATKATLRYMYH